MENNIPVRIDEAIRNLFIQTFITVRDDQSVHSPASLPSLTLLKNAYGKLGVFF